MNLEWKFDRKYFLYTLLLFAVEVIIATTLKDIVWIRAYLGDVIVVWLVYTFLLSFVSFQDKNKVAFWVLMLAFAVEIAQFFNFAAHLGFEDGSVMSIILGNSFSWLDMGCYLLGASVIWTILFLKKIFPSGFMERSNY